MHRKSTSLILLMILSFALSGCGGKLFGDDEKEKFDGIRITKVSSNQNDGAIKHPSTLHPTYVSNVLVSLYYKSTVTGEVHRIFSQEDIETTASQFIGLFQQMNNDEKASFRYYGKTGRETKGSCFIDEDDNWNWVFTKIDGGTPEGNWEIFTGTYFKNKVISTLLQGDIVKTNWVLTNKSRIPEKVEGIAGGKDEQNEMLQPQATRKTSDPSEELNKVKDASERLRFLNKLLEGGYITKEDYEEQKQRILDRM